MPVEVPLVMDRAYESDETRQLVLEMNMIPVVPPKSNRRKLQVYQPVVKRPQDRDLIVHRLGSNALRQPAEFVLLHVKLHQLRGVGGITPQNLEEGIKGVRVPLGGRPPRSNTDPVFKLSLVLFRGE